MMKRALLLSLGLSTIALHSMAQEDFQRDTISMGNGYANTIFYSLDNQTKDAMSNTNWDLAFRGSPMTVGLYANQAGKNWDVTQLFVENSSDPMTAEDKFMEDLTDEFDALLSSTDLDDYKFFNSVSTWDTGAFNQWSPDDPQINFNLGWGMYDMGSHKIVGQKVFIMTIAPAWPGAPADPAAPKYKLFVKEHDPMNPNRPWEFWYAPLDATTEAEVTKVTFDGADYTEKLFVYFNFEDNDFLDQEPNMDSWDFSFTRYKDLVSQGPQTMWYAVTGVLLNNNIAAFGALDTENEDEFDPENDDVYDFIEWDENITLSAEDINVIGRDWRGSNVDNEYEIVPNAYFVKSKDGKTYHLRFRRAALGSSGPEGLEGGDIVFEYKVVDEGVSVNEWKNDFQLDIYPNPSNGRLTLNIQNNLAPQVSDIVVTDMNGRHLMTKQQHIQSGQQSVNLDISTLANGMYLVFVQLDQGLISKKVIKQ